ncbi:MAG TPA: alpha/beta hydrolase-fold protein [Candidatus Angelobacter sp.]|nr:alpha/beta hydrolase-fold protein [Candidatus Angelobacter sp.]
MLSRMLLTSIFLVCKLLFLSTLANASELQIGKAQQGVLHGGRGDTYTVTLKAGDYMQSDVDLRDTELVITVYDPSGSKFRAFRLDSDYGTQVIFIAESTGTYRLEVGGSERSKEGNYSITLTTVVSLDERLAPAPPPELYESDQIKKLKTDLSAGRPNAVADFWKDVTAKTTPLLEPIEGDKQYMRATFLWQGNEATKNVIVQWYPYTRAWPDDYRMAHLAGTNVWYKTFKINRQARFVYRLTPNAGYLRSTRDRDWAQFRMFMAGGQTDPLNPKHWLHFPDNPEAAKYQDWSAVEMPDAPPQPWAAQRPGIPAGTIETEQFKSAMLNNERDLSIYLPPGYDKRNTRQPYGLVVLFDGRAYASAKAIPSIIPGSTTLDNLIAEKRIPPVVALLIDNPPGLRNFELACNRKFLESLNAEMIPWVRQHYNVTQDPKNTVVAGLSFGGLSAACAAFYHPETFGNALSQSGAFSWTPSKSDNPLEFKLIPDPDVEPNWMVKQFLASPRIPVRFYLTIGTDEFDPSGRGLDGLTSNRHLRDVLLAKGYEVHYQEYYGGHDFLSWRGSIADGLIALIGTGRSLKH